MIRLSDAFILAYTKLRTRKVRLTVTVVLASMLLGLLVFGVTVVRGVVDSTEKFTTSGLASRYIVNVSQMIPSNVYDDKTIQTRANEIYTNTITDKKIEAKRLGIDYDSTSEIKPVTTQDGHTSLDTSSPAAIQALAEQGKSQPTAEDNARELAKQYHPKAVFSLKPSTINGTISEMSNGKESFKTQDVTTSLNEFSLKRTLADGWNYTNTTVVKSFLLSDQQLASQKNIQDIPIVAPYSDVEKSLGLEPLPKTATSRQQRDRIAYVKSHAETATFTACYRNQASKQLIDQSVSVAKEIEANKSNKNYQKPDVIYELPSAESCGAAIVTRDVRTTEQISLDNKRLEFNRTFDVNSDPYQQKITFRVVGISPDAISFESFSGVQAIMQTIVGSSLQGMWVVPQSIYDQIPNKQVYQQFDTSATAGLSNHMPIFGNGIGALVEFNNADDARAFFEAKNCSGMSCADPNASILSYFGSNSLLVDDMEKGMTIGLKIIGGVVATIAAIIMMGMVGRIMTDSRRETAVFRAIGAKRNDIRAIYYIYTLLLSLIIATTSIAIGIGLGAWLDSLLSSEATIQAQLAFGTQDSSIEFHFFGWWFLGLLSVIGIVIAAGFISVLLPLSRNVRRNPINDMRDDR